MILKTNQKGFTLMELMTTLLIVGILTSIATVSYKLYRNRALLSEAYSGVDMISKNETSYFITNKSFISTSPNPGYFQYSTSTLYGPPAYPTSTWDTVGYPFPIGSNVLFNYTVYAGKTDTSGNQVVTAIGADGSGFFSTGVPLYSMRNITPYGPGCTNYAVNNYDHMDEYVTAQGKIQYNWAVVQASRDINPDTDLCTYVVKVLETDSTGNIVKGPAIKRDKGD